MHTVRLTLYSNRYLEQKNPKKAEQGMNYLVLSVCNLDNQGSRIICGFMKHHEHV